MFIISGIALIHSIISVKAGGICGFGMYVLILFLTSLFVFFITGFAQMFFDFVSAECVLLEILLDIISFVIFCIIKTVPSNILLIIIGVIFYIVFCFITAYIGTFFFKAHQCRSKVARTAKYIEPKLEKYVGEYNQLAQKINNTNNKCKDLSAKLDVKIKKPVYQKYKDITEVRPVIEPYTFSYMAANDQISKVKKYLKDVDSQEEKIKNFEKQSDEYLKYNESRDMDLNSIEKTLLKADEFSNEAKENQITIAKNAFIDFNNGRRIDKKVLKKAKKL